MKKQQQISVSELLAVAFRNSNMKSTEGSKWFRFKKAAVRNACKISFVSQEKKRKNGLKMHKNRFYRHLEFQNFPKPPLTFPPSTTCAFNYQGTPTTFHGHTTSEKRRQPCAKVISRHQKSRCRVFRMFTVLPNRYAFYLSSQNAQFEKFLRHAYSCTSN